ncbi:MAG: hypothetical protein HLUCCO17_14995 [Saliniramus fredricksonii]|uniref:Uncharacterized conserved protein, DUF2336 family n=1 Tax=Saliniramus fredricksonii TaxID=1653334 RepID=A0A0P8BJA8_9HYPH|nr:DUF2336 domain-containing protein [Saliniramus fredricksonii]KPQ09407.1 MAG: hypothetical protein HLUCCO17_14995 [Saliniramus fredricksonii]SCC80904.1 Uncharacterized conserved protein, DUF2336 family [Saliniramus fredricksonii]
MIVRRFLLWARTAPPGQRADAVSALARTFLYSELSQEDHWEAETALTAMLDDPAPLVRRALAEALANAPDAPRHIIVALANDQPDIAALVLARSPLLSTEDLVDCAALGDSFAQIAIALRVQVTPPVCAALAEIASADALIELVGNPGAEIPHSALARMLARHRDVADLREAMLARRDLPLEIRQSIAVAVADTLKLFVLERGWMNPARTERVVREAREKTTIALSDGVDSADVRGLVAHLRETGQLTPALILRAVLSHGLAFAEAAFSELADLPLARVAGLIQDRRGAGFPALYRKAGMPQALQPAFEAALSALREPARDGAAAGPQLSRRMIERVLSACTRLPADEAGKLLALLRRYESEAAREEAREMTLHLIDDAALDMALGHVEEGIARAIAYRSRLAA